VAGALAASRGARRVSLAPAVAIGSARGMSGAGRRFPYPFGSAARMAGTGRRGGRGVGRIMASADVDGSSSDLIESVEEVPYIEPPKPKPNWLVPIAIGVGLFAALGVWVKVGLDAEAAEAAVNMYGNEEAEAEAHEMAQSRIRQATYIHKALGFLRMGNVPRTMAELSMALKENENVREPILESSFDFREVRALYALAALESLEQPAHFSYLLQLRTMLNLDEEEASKLSPPPKGQWSIFR